LTAAASQGISWLIEGPPVSAELLGATTRGAWLHAGDHVIVLSQPGPTRLPNGIAVGQSDWPISNSGPHLSVGDGGLQIGDSSLTIIRWWDPIPTLRQVSPGVLATTSTAAAEVLSCPGSEVLESALNDRDSLAIRDSLLELLGNGSGLTPEGDDVLVGVLAGLRLLGPVVGLGPPVDLLKPIELVLLAEAPFRTTSLSIALFRHAAAGEVAAPVAELLRALTGEAKPSEAVEHLCDMGDTSGAATACGVLIAARVLLKETTNAR
jgi:hypothetical protein